jgi:hypothetical protein
MRNTIEFTIKDSNRDYGKVFIITEMSAVQGEDLAEDVFRVMSRNNFYSIPPEVMSMGTAGLATIGLAAIANANREEARAISQRLLSTVKVRIEHEGKTLERALDAEADIEEVSTLRFIKDEVFRLNFDFLTTAAESNTPT